jgi:ATP-dependent helicase HepA
MKNASLLRQGTPLIDGCERYMRYDDRGTAFATWRVEPDWGDEDELSTAFRLCFIVEPGIPESETLLVKADIQGLRRRANVYLEPWSRTLHVDLDGNVIEDSRLVRALSRAYNTVSGPKGQRDYNLGSRLAALHSIVDPNSFATACKMVRERAEHVIISDPLFVRRIAEAKERADTDLDRYRQRIERRIQLDTRARVGLEGQLKVNEIVRLSIAQPRIRLDAIGFFIVGNASPPVHT